MRLCLVLLSYLVLTSAGLASSRVRPSPSMKIDVDATQVRRRLIHAHIEVPVAGHNVTLSYPLWNPGDHAPIQGVGQIGSLTFRSNRRTLTWRRDLVDVDSFHITVPKDATTVDADFDFLLPAPGDSFADSSQHLLMLRWNLYLLYIAGQPTRNIPVEATVKLPEGWKFGTALPIDKVDGSTVRFNESSLETLVDSPVLAGEFMRTVDLTQREAHSHLMDIAAESADDLPSEQSVIEKYGTLIRQAQLLFEVEHFRDYHFLVAVSDYTNPGAGFEHSESSDNRVPSNYFRSTPFDVIPHELVHSWNGKYRRPADLYPDDYQQPEKTDLLWVYESLTDYLGVVLTSRSGLWTDEYSRDRWAAIGAKVDHETGRTWRSMQDTANSVPLTMNELFFSNPGWSSWLRMLDYYDEGALLWLEADEIIAEQTHGQRSLRDFLRSFYGCPWPGGAPQVKTYKKADVLAALNRTAPYEWRSFFEKRLNSLSPHAPLGGLEKSGWRLVYNATPSLVTHTFMYSLGLAVGGDGTVTDIERGGLCDTAGLVPGMKIVTVNGEPWAPAKLLAAVVASKRAANSIRLGTQFAGVSNQFILSYHGGMLYPHLERIQDRADTLTVLMQPLSR